MILNEQVMKRIMLDQSYNWAKSCPVPHLHFIFEMLFWPGVNMLIVYVECVNGSAGSCVYFAPLVVKVNSNLNVRCQLF